MRTHHFLLLFTLAVAACSKHEMPATPPPTPIFYKDTAAALPFISTPLAADRLQLTLPGYAGITKVYLKQDTNTLGTYKVTPSTTYQFNITYPFVAGKTYSIILETAPIDNVALHYTLPAYTHTYVSTFAEQQLLPIVQSLGPDMMDISPSRKTVFFTDDVNNVLITKRLSLINGAVDTVSTGNYPFIRAISDNEILTLGSTYNGRRLGADSGTLIRTNLDTKQSSFVAFIANNSNISRVINAHVLVSGPATPYGTADMQLVNLADGTKRVYPYPSVNPLLIGKNNFDHLYYSNQLVDPAAGTFQSVIPAGDSSGIEVIDSTTGYTIASWTSGLLAGNYPPPVGMFQGHLSVYQHGGKVYQSADATSASFTIPRQTQIVNNRLLYYQTFGWDTAWHVSGYYQLDLNAKTTTLLQCHYSPYIEQDFQLDPHTMISVRTDAVYRITLP